MTAYATIGDLEARYPHELTLLAADEQTGLRDDVRIGHALTDASIEIRAILNARYSPADLAGHNCIRFNFRRSVDEWTFRRLDGSAERRAVSGNLLVSSGSVIRQFCLAGVGIGRIGRFHVEPDIKSGALVPLLEDYNAGDLEEVHAVFAGHDHLAARIRAFVDFLASRL